MRRTRLAVRSVLRSPGVVVWETVLALSVGYNDRSWWHGCGSHPAPVSTDAKATKILARTFFNQLRSSGYTPAQVIAVATELIDLVATDIKEGDKASPAPSPYPGENRPAA